MVSFDEPVNPGQLHVMRAAPATENKFKQAMEKIAKENGSPEVLGVERDVEDNSWIIYVKLHPNVEPYW